MAEQFVAKISGKGQVTLPKQLRNKFGLKEGDYLIIYPQGSGFRIEKAVLSTHERFRQIAEATERRFREDGITPADVEEAIKWSRK